MYDSQMSFSLPSLEELSDETTLKKWEAISNNLKKRLLDAEENISRKKKTLEESKLYFSIECSTSHCCSDQPPVWTTFCSYPADDHEKMKELLQDLDIKLENADDDLRITNNGISRSDVENLSNDESKYIGPHVTVDQLSSFIENDCSDDLIQEWNGKNIDFS